MNKSSEEMAITVQGLKDELASKDTEIAELKAEIARFTINEQDWKVEIERLEQKVTNLHVEMGQRENLKKKIQHRKAEIEMFKERIHVIAEFCQQRIKGIPLEPGFHPFEIILCHCCEKPGGSSCVDCAGGERFKLLFETGSNPASAPVPHRHVVTAIRDNRTNWCSCGAILDCDSGAIIEDAPALIQLGEWAPGKIAVPASRLKHPELNGYVDAPSPGKKEDDE
jgi:regulator of replication initiation timing